MQKEHPFGKCGHAKQQTNDWEEWKVMRTERCGGYWRRGIILHILGRYEEWAGGPLPNLAHPRPSSPALKRKGEWAIHQNPDGPKKPTHSLLQHANKVSPLEFTSGLG